MYKSDHKKRINSKNSFITPLYFYKNILMFTKKPATFYEKMPAKSPKRFLISTTRTICYAMLLLSDCGLQLHLPYLSKL